jgi:hypothetical protein
VLRGLIQDVAARKCYSVKEGGWCKASILHLLCSSSRSRQGWQGHGEAACCLNFMEGASNVWVRMILFKESPPLECSYSSSRVQQWYAKAPLSHHQQALT